MSRLFVIKLYSNCLNIKFSILEFKNEIFKKEIFKNEIFKNEIFKNEIFKLTNCLSITILIKAY